MSLPYGVKIRYRQLVLGCEVPCSERGAELIKRIPSTYTPKIAGGSGAT